MSGRRLPNIMVTGTPGTGKTTLCEMVAQQSGFKHVNVGEWVKEQNLHSGWDEEFQCFILDEDKVRAPRRRGRRAHRSVVASNSAIS